MWVSLSVTRTGAALKDFLSTVTVDTVPGLGWISIVPDSGKAKVVAPSPSVGVRPKLMVAPTWPMSLT